MLNRCLRVVHTLFFVFLAASCAEQDPPADLTPCEDGDCRDDTPNCGTAKGATESCTSCTAGFEKRGGDCVPTRSFDGPCAENANICGVGTCVATQSHYACDCPPGFDFDGTTCVDVDECETDANACDIMAECINTMGSYECECLDGLQSSESGCQPFVTNIAAGGNFTCAILENGELYCWGSNYNGELGVGDLSITHSAPQRVTGDHLWKSVHAGRFSACGITDQNDLYCWGDNSHGNLGNDHIGGKEARPALVSGGHKWLQAAAGPQHTCGITSQHKLYCWGSAADGRLGISPAPASTESIATPTIVRADLTWKYVASGDSHSCGITDTDTLYCWGNNGESQLGTGLSPNEHPTLLPSPILEGHEWSSVTLGRAHSCGISEGKLYCWGAGAHGQLGLGTEDNAGVPTPVGDDANWTQLSAHAETTCARNKQNAYCWGQHWPSIYSVQNLLTPTPIHSDHFWSQVATGHTHSCAISNDHIAYCWGRNGIGQTGHNGSTDILRPSPVGFFR